MNVDGVFGRYGLFPLHHPQMLPHQHDFKVFFVPGHAHHCGDIQHKFPDKQYHAKEHLALDFLSSRQTKPCKLIPLAGFFQPFFLF
jgi:hypothetical protein